jgi:hypothetical protein
VGKKYKREDEDEGIEWEEQQPYLLVIHFCQL